MLGLNLGSDTSYSKFLVFFTVLPTNSEIIPRLGQHRFLPNPFHPSFDAIKTQTVLVYAPLTMFALLQDKYTYI